ncbi:DUF389 domain-containing protein [Hymenobacter sediminis]|uniref:DUF389 domain-containing protein n=1 Tax=Hymenobacter sediminis TaxID=2218621 RepID=UPI001EE4BA92|nr:DUF389 domain-containing protein [Hymenobacter sediminis]
MLGLVGVGEASAHDLLTNPEVHNIIDPGVKELLVSACGAAAGVVIIAAYRRSVIAGALIALVLMPAAALLGSSILVGEYQLALGALKRFGLVVVQWVTHQRSVLE